MSRNVFGWDLPPGVTQRMIDDQFGTEAPCDVCGKWADDCICPECPVCGEYGNPACYAADGDFLPDPQRTHGLTRSDAQVRTYAEFQAEQDALAAAWTAYAAAEYQAECIRAWADHAPSDDLGPDPLGDWHGRNE
jgi:hypothetical protein